MRWQHPFTPTWGPTIHTWSHRFFCFASSTTNSIILTKGGKESLTVNGLGEKVIFISSTANAEEFHSLLLQSYPLLEFCGGYTLLRCNGKSKTLSVLEPAPGGHTPLSLSGIVGQSRVCIRPLQRDILLESPRVGVGRYLPRMKCLKCNMIFQMDVLQDHVSHCNAIPSDNDDFEDFVPGQPGMPETSSSGSSNHQIWRYVMVKAWTPSSQKISVRWVEVVISLLKIWIFGSMAIAVFGGGY
jgi:hypothetical protein